jgi:hypothetical protein
VNSWKHLPVEILDPMFDEITDRKRNYKAVKDLCQCQPACKNWRDPSQRRLYESISIRTYRKLGSYTKL